MTVLEECMLANVEDLVLVLILFDRADTRDEPLAVGPRAEPFG